MSVERIRVLEVITSLAGGAGQHVVQLARGLDPRRFDVRLVFGPGYPLDARVADQKLPHDLVVWTRSLNPVATVLGTAQLRALVRKHRPHVVHAHCSLAGALARPIARAARVPRVLFTFHAFASRDHQPALHKRAYLAIERGLDRFTDHYCVTTQWCREQIAARGISPEHRVSVIPLGIELPIAPSNTARAAARRRLGLEPEDRAVAVIGRLEEQKGIRYALRAMPRVTAALPRTRLLVVGDGPLREPLQAEARALRCADAVTFLGWRDDLPRLLPGMDVVCVPSLWESFSYVILEALAAAVPVVASRTDAIPEVVSGAQCAVLTPPGEPVALAEGLLTLLRDEAHRQTLGRNGRRYVEDAFDVQKMIERHEELYERLLRERAQAA